MRLTILDQISDPGSLGKPNDDCPCRGENLAAVFDGATGIGDRLVFPDLGSDAAWLARLAAETFAQAGASADPAEIVRRTSASARAAVSAATDLDRLARHAWPTCSFEMARLGGDFLELAGLGDCIAFVREASGASAMHSAMPANREREMAWARRLLGEAGGFDAMAEIPRRGEILEKMRHARDRHNTPGGNVWTLGLVEEAAARISRMRLPAATGTRILLMSDGFSALVEAYRRHSPEALIPLAGERGLAALLGELRQIERVEDPDAAQFPRFKRCDDATAILAEIA
jgi:hypothetical protein